MRIEESAPRSPEAQENDYLRVIRNLQYQIGLREQMVMRIAAASGLVEEEETKNYKGTEVLLVGATTAEWVAVLKEAV